MPPLLCSTTEKNLFFSSMHNAIKICCNMHSGISSEFLGLVFSGESDLCSVLNWLQMELKTETPVICFNPSNKVIDCMSQCWHYLSEFRNMVNSCMHVCVMRWNVISTTQSAVRMKAMMRWCSMMLVWKWHSLMNNIQVITSPLAFCTCWTYRSVTHLIGSLSHTPDTLIGSLSHTPDTLIGSLSHTLLTHCLTQLTHSLAHTPDTLIGSLSHTPDTLIASLSHTWLTHCLTHLMHSLAHSLSFGLNQVLDFSLKPPKFCLNTKFGFKPTVGLTSVSNQVLNSALISNNFIS